MHLILLAPFNSLERLNNLFNTVEYKSIRDKPRLQVYVTQVAELSLASASYVK